MDWAEKLEDLIIEEVCKGCEPNGGICEDCFGNQFVADILEAIGVEDTKALIDNLHLKEE